MTRDQAHDSRIVQLYQDEYGRLVQLARLLLHDSGAAEEVVQEAFVRLYGRWPQMRHPDRAAAYVRSVVCNLARDRLRRRGLSRRKDTPAPDVYHPDDPGLADDRRRLVATALDRLPDRQRQALVLRYWAELSQREIAAALGITEGSVKRHLHRGLAALAVSLEEHR